MQGYLTAGDTLTQEHIRAFGRITTRCPHMIEPGDMIRYDANGRVWSVADVDSQTGATVERLLNRATRRAQASSKRKARGY